MIPRSITSRGDHSSSAYGVRDADVLFYMFVDGFKRMARVAVSASQLDISNLNTRSAKMLARQMGHLEVDVTFGMMHLR